MWNPMNECRRMYGAQEVSLPLVLWLIFLLSTAGSASGALFELQVIRAVEGNEQIVYRSPTCPFKTFRISYTHSLDKCPIVEIFRIEKDATITLTEEIYGWFGAGLEFNPETGFTDMKDHQVHIKDIGRNMPSIFIRVGWISGFRLEYDNGVVPLSVLARPGELLMIKISRQVDPHRKK